MPGSALVVVTKQRVAGRSGQGLVDPWRNAAQFCDAREDGPAYRRPITAIPPRAPSNPDLKPPHSYRDTAGELLEFSGGGNIRTRTSPDHSRSSRRASRAPRYSGISSTPPPGSHCRPSLRRGGDGCARTRASSCGGPRNRKTWCWPETLISIFYIAKVLRWPKGSRCAASRLRSYLP